MELFTPDLGLVFWMFLAFLILFLALAKWGWPAILKSMDSRADTIDKGVEYAHQAKEQLDNAKEEARKYVTEAQTQQAEILRQAALMKDQIIEEARKEAQVAAKKVMDDAQISIKQQQKEAEKSLRDEVSKFSLQIAEKMMRTKMENVDAQNKLVDQMLNEIQSN